MTKLQPLVRTQAANASSTRVRRFAAAFIWLLAVAATACDEDDSQNALDPDASVTQDSGTVEPRDSGGVDDANIPDMSNPDLGDASVDVPDAGDENVIVLGARRAFPSAAGAGSITTGGRGGRVIHVTNLDDSGAGSFREALLATGPRTVVFDVSGRINLNTRIELIAENSDLTIAGETAPEGGITISGKPLLLAGGYDRATSSTDNVIIRHVRFRNGSYTGEADAYDHNGIISGGSDRFVFDHLSFSFNDDQALSLAPFFAPLQDGTIQRCIFSENATGIIVGNQSAQYLDGTNRISTLENLFVHQGHRTPNLALNGRADIINNVLFSWGSRLTNINGGNGEVNFIGNHLTAGSEYAPGAGQDNKVQAPATPTVYTANNYHSVLYPTPQLDDRGLWTNFSSSEALPDARFTTTQHPLLAATVVMTATQTRTSVLADVGTNAFVSATGVSGHYLDTYDTLHIQDVRDEVSRNPFNKVWTQPVLPTNTRSGDFYGGLSDIPEFFATAHSITSNDQVLASYQFDGYRVQNDAGYSALEMYLFFAAGDFDRLR